MIAEVSIGLLRGFLPTNDGHLARVSLTKRIYYDTVSDHFLTAIIERSRDIGDNSLFEVYTLVLCLSTSFRFSTPF